MRRVKTFWFAINKKGMDIPVYDRKAYKKARVKRQSERMCPGHWDMFVKGKYDDSQQ